MKEAIQKAIEGGRFHKGNTPANKGKHTIRKCDFCSTENRFVCFYKKWQHLLCEKHYYHFKKHGKALWGDERPLVTPLPRREKHMLEIGIAWRKSVFERDNYTCQECGVRGVQIQADHIKPFAYFPDLRWVLSNGRTLCILCHKATDTWGRKGQKIYGTLQESNR